MNKIQIAQHDLLNSIDTIVSDFAEEKATEGIGTEDYSTPSVEEACEYITTLSDTPEVWDNMENIFKALIEEKWEEYISIHQQNWADDKAKAETEKSLMPGKV